MHVPYHCATYYSFPEVDKKVLNDTTEMTFNHILVNSFARYFPLTSPGSGLHRLTLSAPPTDPPLAPPGRNNFLLILASRYFPIPR